MRLVISTVVAFALLAPAALAHDGGQGTYGEVDDKVTTNAGFIVIGFFPLAPWAGFAVLCIWTALALGLANVALQRRDA